MPVQYGPVDSYATISDNARRKLENHAWLVEFYATLRPEERMNMLRNTVRGMEKKDLPDAIMDEVIGTLQFYLNIDPAGGRKKSEQFEILDYL